MQRNSWSALIWFKKCNEIYLKAVLTFFFFCKHQTGQGNELGVEILLKKSRGNCLWFIYLIIRWSWWLAIMCFNIWKQQCEELGLFEEWLGKSSPELKWKKKKIRENRTSGCLSDKDLQHHECVTWLRGRWGGRKLAVGDAEWSPRVYLFPVLGGGHLLTVLSA